MRVVLRCHASTSAVRSADFPADEPLDDLGTRQAGEAGADLPRIAAVRCAPSRRCRATAEAFGLPFVVDAQLRGPDHGVWTGRTLDDVGAADPAGLRSWLADPDFRGHGGEPLSDLVMRVGAWLDARSDPPHALLAVCDPAVVRAAVVHAIGAPPHAMWRIDVAPLSTTLLVGEPGRWNLRGLVTGRDSAPA